MTSWAFQCNVQRVYRLWDALRARQRINAWTARQHLGLMNVGDEVALYVAGGVGFVAAGTLTTLPFWGKPDGFWKNPKTPQQDFVGVEFDRNVFHSPVSK